MNYQDLITTKDLKLDTQVFFCFKHEKRDSKKSVFVTMLEKSSVNI